MSMGTPPWPDDTKPSPPCPRGCGRIVHWNPCETAESLTVEEDAARARAAAKQVQK